MSGQATREGGCLCGGVRYRIDEPVESVVHCHCHMCRRASGAPVMTWISVPARAFHVTRGSLATFESSKGAKRTFCPTCGAQFTFRSGRDPDSIDVTLGTLDKPDDLVPQHHIWTSSRLSAIHVDDGLPAYPEFSPKGDT